MLHIAAQADLKVNSTCQLAATSLISDFASQEEKLQEWKIQEALFSSLLDKTTDLFSFQRSS